MTLKNNTPTPIDWDAVDALYAKARQRDVIGDTKEAERLYRTLLDIDPDDHLGVSLRLARLAGTPLSRAPSAYVATLFDQIAERFDAILVDELDYAVPLLIADALTALGFSTFENWLDLGCGTGLCAMALEDMTIARTGVDLAPTMVEIASELDLYQDLYIADIITFLTAADGGGPHHLVTAADVFPYLGDLTSLFEGLDRVTQAGSLFAFSTERAAENAGDVEIGPHKRFAHAHAYIEQTLDRFGWSPLYQQPITVRREHNEPVFGDLIIAQKGLDHPR